MVADDESADGEPPVDAASDGVSDADADPLAADVAGGVEAVEDGGGEAGGVAEPEPEAPPEGELDVLLGGLLGEEPEEGGLLDVVDEPAGAVVLPEPVAPVPEDGLELALEPALVLEACVAAA